MAAYTIKPVITAIAINTGGRNGHSETTDHSVSVNLSVRKEMGGPGLADTTTPEHTALVHAAAGGVGVLLTQMAKRACAVVIATVSTPEKARLAREAGADEVIIYAHSKFDEEVMRITKGMGLDVVYDGVGKSTFEQSLKCLRRRGLLALYGCKRPSSRV
jgi:NADPH:quinone reductase-like Zn-dependent oxidoreductase